MVFELIMLWIYERLPPPMVPPPHQSGSICGFRYRIQVSSLTILSLLCGRAYFLQELADLSVEISEDGFHLKLIQALKRCSVKIACHLAGHLPPLFILERDQGVPLVARTGRGEQCPQERRVHETGSQYHHMASLGNASKSLLCWVLGF